MSMMLEELVAMDAPAAFRKIAAVAVLARRMSKQAAGFGETLGNVGQQLGNFAQHAGQQLQQGNPLYTAGAAGLGFGGLAAAREAMQPAHRRRWSNALLAGGVGAGLGAALPTGVAAAKDLLESATDTKSYNDNPSIMDQLGRLGAGAQAVGGAAATGLNSLQRGITGTPSPDDASAVAVGRRMPFTAAGAVIGGHHRYFGGKAKQMETGWRAMQAGENAAGHAAAQQAVAHVPGSTLNPATLVNDTNRLTNQGGPMGYYDRYLAAKSGVPAGGRFSMRQRLLGAGAMAPERAALSQGILARGKLPGARAGLMPLLLGLGMDGMSYLGSPAPAAPAGE